MFKWLKKSKVYFSWRIKIIWNYNFSLQSVIRTQPCPFICILWLLLYYKRAELLIQRHCGPQSLKYLCIMYVYILIIYQIESIMILLYSFENSQHFTTIFTIKEITVNKKLWSQPLYRAVILWNLLYSV